MNISWEFSLIDFISIAVVIVLIILIFVARYFAKKSKETGVDRKFVKDRWQKIEELMRYGKEMNYKLAIIEADKLLDYVLKSMYFPGQTMAERLKLASYKFPGLKQVWWAHKVRNQIVHDAHYTVTSGETRKVLGLFKKSFKELKVL